MSSSESAGNHDRDRTSDRGFAFRERCGFGREMTSFKCSFVLVILEKMVREEVHREPLQHV